MRQVEDYCSNSGFGAFWRAFTSFLMVHLSQQWVVGLLGHVPACGDAGLQNQYSEKR